MSKNVLIVAGDAVEALEIYYPYYRLLEEGYQVTIAAPKKKKLHTVVHDFADWDTYVEKQGYLIEAQAAFADIDPNDYDGLVIPGGRAPEYIRLDADLQRIVRHFFEANKPIAAICHASLIFETMSDVVKGRSLTAYIACKPGVEALGATYVSDRTIHVDQNLVSAHAWPDLPIFMREFIRLLQ
ncbi:intracellular protease, PfpI family protein [Anoxybacillus sp. B7M1]|jgi:protease I|uniref:DJ-1/PfpI family protein n=1 Tax=unclassified Anoxybacillus TaxID=2639704 RepID=UPI0005CCD443|nr:MULTISPECIES: DJ-1/PfpI family protein [unclassified Anoxybacillus]ANB57342.1 intracellular protease, PfpI family protein [Anoxybacillus sp. B2M1]ANB62654.1 intracellular protease, PfpI family protein [Anoxybacillus sp. B7M1]